LTWPERWACTSIATKLLNLGRSHWRYNTGDKEGAARRSADEKLADATSLWPLARQHRLAGAPPDRLKEVITRCRSAAAGRRLDDRDLINASWEAVFVAQLYPLLRERLRRDELTWHYDNIELPAVLSFADVERVGVCVDPPKIRVAFQAADAMSTATTRRLREYGLYNVDSHVERVEVFRRAA
jgi:hypothetical protein